MPALLAGTLAASFLIGFGPALHLVSGGRRRAEAALLAPVLGLALLGLFLYPLVRADFTVGRCGRPLLLAGVALSAALVWRDHRRQPAGITRGRRGAWWPVAGAMAVVAALSLPAWRGGPGHTLWQGNETDAGFYLGVAAYARDVPWSWARDAGRDQEVVQRSVAAAGGIGLVASEWRPAAALTVAWAAALWNRPLTETYYAVALLGPALAFTAMLAVAGRLGLRGPWRAAPALVVATGFWAHVLVDMNATGQAFALPLSLLVLFAWLQVDAARGARLFSRERALLALALAALFGFYAEMMPLLLAALALHAALQWRELGAAWAARAAVVVALAVACLAPALGAHLSYLGAVTSAAFGRPREGWAEYFFPWLYDHEVTLAGLWGLHLWRVAARACSLGAATWPLASVLVGGGLCAALVALLWRARHAHHRAERVLAAAVAAFWGGAVILCWRGQPWLAGKAFGYGFPFACAGVFVALAHAPARWQPWALALAGAWTASQAATFALRLPATRPGGAPIPGYVRLRTEGLEEITRLDLGAGPLAADLTGALPYRRKAWTLLLASRADVVPLHSVPGRLGRPLWREGVGLPARLLLARERDYVAAQGLALPVQATDALALYELKPRDYDLLLTSPRPPAAPGPLVGDAIECDAAAPSAPARCWLVGGAAGLRFLASGERALRATVDLVPLVPGRWRVLANGTAAAEFAGAAGAPARVALSFLPRPGTNWIRFVRDDGAAAGRGSPSRRPPRTAALEAVAFAAAP